MRDLSSASPADFLAQDRLRRSYKGDARRPRNDQLEALEAMGLEKPSGRTLLEPTRVRAQHLRQAAD